MKGDRELANLRQKYYGLFVKLFWKEPDSEFLLSLLDGIAEREKRSARSSSLISEGWKEIRHYLEKKGADEVEYEFVQLFLGPHQPDIMPYESYYLSGRVFQVPLAAVRGFMKEVGIEKKEGHIEGFNDGDIAMINIHQKLKEGNFKTKMLLQIHDELIFESPKEEVKRISKLIIDEMSSSISLEICSS